MAATSLMVAPGCSDLANSPPGAAHPVAELEVLRAEEIAVVETTEFAKDIGPHHQTSTDDEVDIPTAVRIRGRDSTAVPVRGADGSPELSPDGRPCTRRDGGILPDKDRRCHRNTFRHGLRQPAQAVGFEDRVAVQEAEKVGVARAGPEVATTPDTEISLRPHQFASLGDLGRRLGAIVDHSHVGIDTRRVECRSRCSAHVCLVVPGQDDDVETTLRGVLDIRPHGRQS